MLGGVVPISIIDGELDCEAQLDCDLFLEMKSLTYFENQVNNVNCEVNENKKWMAMLLKFLLSVILLNCLLVVARTVRLLKGPTLGNVNIIRNAWIIK